MSLSSKNKVILKPTLYWQSDKWVNSTMSGLMTLRSLLIFQIGKSCLFFKALSCQLCSTVHVVQITHAMWAWRKECSKDSPKDIQDHTDINVLGYQKYWCRRDIGKISQVGLNNFYQITTLLFHTIPTWDRNLSVASMLKPVSIAAVKYVYKSIYKGPDRFSDSWGLASRRNTKLHQRKTSVCWKHNNDDNGLPKYHDRWAFRWENIAKGPNPAGNPPSPANDEMDNECCHFHALLS